MDGFEVARRIRALPGMEDTLLIAMSGYGRKEDRDAATEAGFNHYLVKPMDLDRLRQLLQEHFTASA
jgi:two-component system CheB/CheR fusion protein